MGETSASQPFQRAAKPDQIDRSVFGNGAGHDLRISRRSVARGRPDYGEHEDPAMNILAIDLGKFESVACLYRGEERATFRTIETRPQEIHDLLVELAPQKLVIEVGDGLRLRA